MKSIVRTSICFLDDFYDSQQKKISFNFHFLCKKF